MVCARSPETGGQKMSQLNSRIIALGYLGVSAPAVDDWAPYATRFLGMQAGERAAHMARYRMDDRLHRLTIHEAQDTGGIRYFGWEVNDAAALQALAAHLELNGVSVHAADAALRAERAVQDLIVFADPAGNRLEAFYGAQTSDQSFVPGRSISGFRCGTLGMGHVVLTVTDLEPLMRFYRDVLGFGVSDYIMQPFRAFFMHVNGRHHALALIQTGKPGVHHIMLEMLGLDDVGQAYDLALIEPDRIGTTLGRHTNDFMTSFYARSPSQFMVEIGWGGRVIDPATWQPFEVTDGPSLWGHDRAWLPAQAQLEARDLRLRVAAQGTRHPVQVLPGQYEVSPER